MTKMTPSTRTLIQERIERVESMLENNRIELGRISSRSDQLVRERDDLQAERNSLKSDLKE